jgi:uncharacterized protein
MNNKILFSLKNFNYDKSTLNMDIKKANLNNYQSGGGYLNTDIKKAETINYQSGGGYINNEGNEYNFLSDNFIGKSNIPDSGYGVFANKDYKKDDIVEINRFLEFSDNRTGLEDYVFKSHLDNTKNIIVLGNGSIFNHHDNNNVNYYFMDGKGFFMYKANKDIKKGEEMYINYGSNWFQNRQKNDK